MKSQTLISRRVFTLEHLKANKLRYLHNGNEDIVDSFVFEMEIKGPEGLDLPLALTMRQRFLFEIRILPVNDPPRLTGAFLVSFLGSKINIFGHAFNIYFSGSYLLWFFCLFLRSFSTGSVAMALASAKSNLMDCLIILHISFSTLNCVLLKKEKVP